MILLVNSDSIRIPLADESVHCVATSPPYWGLRDYGVPGQLGLEPTPEEYVANLVMVFREVWRVLRRDGTVWLNLGSSYWGGKGQSGHANPEYQAKRVEAGESFSQVSAHVGGQGKTRPSDGRHSTFKPKDLIPIPWMVAMALQADGWWLRSDIIWHKPNCMPESVQDRPTTSHEYVFLLAKSRRYFYDGDAIRVTSITNDPRKPYGSDGAWEMDGRNKWDEGAGQPQNRDTTTRNRRSVWTIPTSPYKGAHFATFPPALVEPCIKAGTSERGVCPECGAQWERVVEVERKERELGGRGPKRASIMASSDKSVFMTNRLPIVTTTGWRPTCTCNAGDPIPAIVLDPFVGSGTTCLVARQLGRRSVGLDLSFAYLHDQARTRLELDKLAAWENGKQVEANWEELPLFQTS